MYVWDSYYGCITFKMLSARCIKFPRSFFLPQNCEILDMCVNIFYKSWTFLTKIYCCSVAEVLVGTGPWRKTIVMETVWWIFPHWAKYQDHLWGGFAWVGGSFPPAARKPFISRRSFCRFFFPPGPDNKLNMNSHVIGWAQCKALSEYKKKRNDGNWEHHKFSVVSILPTKDEIVVIHLHLINIFLLLLEYMYIMILPKGPVAPSVFIPEARIISISSNLKSVSAECGCYFIQMSHEYKRLH